MTTDASTVLNRLTGKKFVLDGKFGFRDHDRERLTGLVQAQEGQIVDTLDASVDCLVVPGLSQGKTAQKKVASLNAKGAAIQVIDSTQLDQLAKLTDEEILALIRAGQAKKAIAQNVLRNNHHHYFLHGHPKRSPIVAQHFDGLNLDGLPLDPFLFDQCSFVGSTISGVIHSPSQCDFSKATGKKLAFTDAADCRFVDSRFQNVSFIGFRNADFSGAILEEVQFGREFRTGVIGIVAPPTCSFVKTVLRKAHFHASLKCPDFESAELAGADFHESPLDSPSFKNANAQNVSFFNCKLPNADFTNANLRGANFVDADLTNAKFDGADIDDANFEGATLAGVDLTKAKNHSKIFTGLGNLGPALAELDALAHSAKRVRISFFIRKGKDDDGEQTSIDTNRFIWGWGLQLPSKFTNNYHRNHSKNIRSRINISEALLTLAKATAPRAIRFETLDIETTKSPKAGKELRDLVLLALTEAFGQTPPPAAELGAATKAYRDSIKVKDTVSKEEREAAKAQAEKEAAKELKKIEKKIEKTVGKVNDTATFLKALELRIDAAKIDKATKMLKASGFKLFNDVTDAHVNGVVKSQTDPDLVYACRIESVGKYACCTQNLNVCGGLRGSICKHLLVLIIGLVQANELDPATINDWVAKSNKVKPVLDKEVMGEVFIRYKGAEAGEVDWRPTETVPEDYYSL